MTYNLQPSYPDVSELTTNDKAISVIYGRVSGTGAIVPIQIDAGGALSTSAGIPPSANSFFSDQSVTALTGSYVSQSFGFTSLSINVANDDSVQTIQFSFDGSTLHGVVLPGEAISMDWRAHSSIWLKAVGTPGNYRVWSY